MTLTPDHIGVDLWRAFRAFESAMFDRVATLGFDDITVADSEVLVEIGAEGRSLVQIAQARRVSKQAIQGQVRSLVDRGYLAVHPDPHDARAKRVLHTDKGMRLVTELVGVKQSLHAEVLEMLGAEQQELLRANLSLIADRLSPPKP